MKITFAMYGAGLSVVLGQFLKLPIDFMRGVTILE
jgi:hypothetical protein